MSKQFVIVVFIALLIPNIVWADSNWDTMIWSQDNWYSEGGVIVSGRLGIANASVSLVGATVYNGQTDSNGNFLLINVLDGDYTLQITGTNLGVITKKVTVIGQDLEAYDLPSMIVGCNGDIDGDGKIGLEEALFALEVVAGLRPSHTAEGLSVP